MPGPGALVVMGVSGSGKSTIGARLAERLGWQFIEGDTLHPPANVAKMARGEALDDTDRAPWLAAIADAIGQARGGVVVSCSALKRHYRALFGTNVRLVYLKGSKGLIRQRLANRHGHFMPPSLLDSQFADLEEPAQDEDAIIVGTDGTPDAIVDAIVAKL